MKTILQFIKNEIVMMIACSLAIISIIFFSPSIQTIYESIDFKVLALLFSLMGIIAIFRSYNVLDYCGAWLLRFCKTERDVVFCLVYIVFFFSMLVTNDVGLLTFVPIALIICKQANINPIKVIILQTIAANLGSSVTPMGNPQNLYLFSYFNFSTFDFFKITILLGVISFILLFISILIVTKKQPVKTNNQRVMVKFDLPLILFFIDLIIILLSVFRLLDYKIGLVCTLFLLLIFSPKTIKKIDYSLLITFIGFFIFIGVISQVPQIRNFISQFVNSPELTYFTGILSSQIISNVPAAILLSGFTEYGSDLLLAVNIGGLGTLIASLASVISYKLFSKENPEDTGKYMFQFTIWNVSYLILLVFLFLFIK
jgi:Na+/H+ antiporter NhaD/arsenite permease-like protein